MDQNADILKKLIFLFPGKAFWGEQVPEKYSRDASLFEVVPEAVIIPDSVDEIKKAVRFVIEHPGVISLTARSGGTDMTGGPLSTSVIVDFARFNHLKELSNSGYAIVEPGMYYRDFEKKTLAEGYILPSFPASKNICMLGGMLANNSGGEMTLEYGKTEEYVEELRVVTSDGEEHHFKKLNKEELDAKLNENGFESKIFRDLKDLIEANKEIIENSKPKVSKNSSGYNIWKVWNGEVFDINRLFIGSQGTLGLITEAKLRLVKTKKERGLLVIFLKNFNQLPEIVNDILKYHPVSLESFDDHTFRLALKFFLEFSKVLGSSPIKTIFEFIPDFWRVLFKGMPKLVLLAEFEDDNLNVISRKMEQLTDSLKQFGNASVVTENKPESIEKFFAIRRESFNLLRNKIRGLQTAPFIDDLIVDPKYLTEFLPELYKILDKYNLLYTVAGHVGDGNFHIIPLVKLSERSVRESFFKIGDEVYDLVLKYKGSLSAEHNDGMIRGPYLEKAFGSEMFEVFQKIKQIFDPSDIFNPHKKVEANKEYSQRFIKSG